MYRWTYMIVLLTLSSCSLIEPPSQPHNILFWYEGNLQSPSVDLWINGIQVSHLDPQESVPECGRLSSTYIMNEDEGEISIILSNHSDTIDIGWIDLQSLDEGISIHPSFDGSLYVSRKLDEECTKVRLRWK